MAKSLTSHFPKKLGKAAVWLTAGLYVAMETQEVFELKQIHQITIFALLFVISSYQLNTARYYQFNKETEKENKAKQASFRMFAGSLLAVVDAGVDQLIQDSTQQNNTMVDTHTTAMFYAGWLINLTIAVLVAQSLSSFIEVITSKVSSKIYQSTSLEVK